MNLKIKNVQKLLAKRLSEVGKVRDKLRDDMDELEALKETCERAYENIECAIEALSELA